jgi:hypothetical protein
LENKLTGTQLNDGDNNFQFKVKGKLRINKWGDSEFHTIGDVQGIIFERVKGWIQILEIVLALWVDFCLFHFTELNGIT